MHAWHVARKLGIARVVCPPGAGAGSTIGMLMAPARVDRTASFNQAVAGADLAAARASSRRWRRRRRVLRATGADLDGRVVRRLADMRYIGQGSEITVEMPVPLTREGVQAAFEAAYRALFARTPPGAAAHLVTLRLSVTAPMPGTGNRPCQPRHAATEALKGHRRVAFPEEGTIAGRGL